MDLPISALSRADVYKLLNCIVVPRPIAWITSVSQTGVVNLAPYSTFNIVCYDPPLLGVNMLVQSDGRRKDSARNAIESKEYVVHIAEESLLDDLHASAFTHAPDVSEPEVLNLELVPGVDVKVPRLAAAPLALECRLHRVIEFGPGSEFVVGEVLRIHGRDGLIRDNKIDSAELRPLSRLGGPAYGALGRITVKVPGSR